MNIIYENIFFNKIKYFNKKKLIFLDFRNKNKIKYFLKNKTFKKPFRSKLTKYQKILNDEGISYFNKVKIRYTNNT